MKKKEVTIYDLAKELNFSPSTVSRALNNHKSIGKKTTKEIHKAAQRLGYRPNSIAASLRSNKSKTIGILIARINSPFMSTLISGIEDTARKANYNVLISQSNESYENEVNNAKALYDSRVGGVIVSLAMETVDTSHFKQFLDKNIPVVFVDRVPKEFNSYRVVIDNYAAGYRATKHLIDQGCTRIAHFAGSQHVNVYNMRKKGYIDALTENGIELDEKLIISLKTMSSTEGWEATEKLLGMSNPPDGIFSSNDSAAVSAIRCAKERGVKIPEELAIIGFNDDPVASIVEPSLSTISHPARRMGEISALRILEHSKENLGTSVSEITMLDTKVVVRNSSKRNP
ncbi:LacI family DNA-binding transcriptional regulator [Salinimicrobium sp. MT39]|uniref:LacI family DNA-binding transcriptional regulator n=1 Tax=Salinimicrobium profundisediminis TaxID=2994553 RepID=A0A9X3CWJ9_9FLAO|nr:LacI family DNA-binding transcriptional regulator [Salinimicrobium profundisediminis]MCX2837955.1 LacI family DNA-binding transcriptional regulator [Salinimicrobium profundisediminis]